MWYWKPPCFTFCLKSYFSIFLPEALLFVLTQRVNRKVKAENDLSRFLLIAPLTNATRRSSSSSTSCKYPCTGSYFETSILKTKFRENVHILCELHEFPLKVYDFKRMKSKPNPFRPVLMVNCLKRIKSPPRKRVLPCTKRGRPGVYFYVKDSIGFFNTPAESIDLFC